MPEYRISQCIPVFWHQLCWGVGFWEKKVEKSWSFQLQATFWKLYKVLLEILTHRIHVHWCFLDGFQTKNWSGTWLQRLRTCKLTRGFLILATGIGCWGVEPIMFRACRDRPICDYTRLLYLQSTSECRIPCATTLRWSQTSHSSEIEILSKFARTGFRTFSSDLYSWGFRAIVL